jgi:hypothetical protein
LKSRSKVLLSCAAAVAAAQCFSVSAQPLTRQKARLAAFDGQVMTLEPMAPLPPASANSTPLTVSVTPATRYVGSNKALFSDIKPGDYAGAALSPLTGDHLRAQEVFLYAEALRGTGQGRFPEGDRLIVNGTVSAVKPSPDGRQDGALTLHYHGSVLTGLGRGKTVCEGRASPPAYASALACEGDAVVEVPPATSVSSLSEGDKRLLVPGSTLTVAIFTGPDGKNSTPGVVVEKPAPVEKSKTRP